MRRNLKQGKWTLKLGWDGRGGGGLGAGDWVRTLITPWLLVRDPAWGNVLVFQDSGIRGLGNDEANVVGRCLAWKPRF